MKKYERPLRLATGLVIAAYVAGHFLNHALGIVSLGAMDALRRVDAAPNVRLACQTCPSEDAWITPLVPAGAGSEIARRPGGVQGHEQHVVAMFVDLRGSTVLGETRFPYDVVFILNQFFAENFRGARDDRRPLRAIHRRRPAGALRIARRDRPGLPRGATLVVSLDTLRFGGVPFPDVPVHRVEVRGKAQRIEVLAIEDPGALLLDSD